LRRSASLRLFHDMMRAEGLGLIRFPTGRSDGGDLAAPRRAMPVNFTLGAVPRVSYD